MLHPHYAIEAIAEWIDVVMDWEGTKKMEHAHTLNVTSKNLVSMHQCPTL